MKNILFAGFTLILISFISCSFFDSEIYWKDITPKDGKFTVSLPGTPKSKGGFQRLSQNSSLATTTYSYEPLLKKIPSFAVGIARFKSWGLQKVEFDDERMYDGYIRGFSKSMNGKVTQQENVGIAGTYGREYRLDTQDGKKVITRMLRNGNDLYSLSIAFKEGDDWSDEIKTFFDSFVLNE